MATRRNTKTRRTAAAPKTKPAAPAAPDTPTVPAAPVQAQAVEVAAEALLADARTRADEIITEALDDAEAKVRAATEQGARLRSDAEREAETLRKQATVEMDQLLAAARAEATRLREDAEGQASDRQTEAEHAAQRTEKSAQERADRLHQAAVTDAEKLADDARDRADRIGALAVEEAQRVTLAAREEADELLAEARTAATRSQQIIDNATADAQRIAEEADGLRARTLASADNEAKAIREAARAETQKQEQRNDRVDNWSARAIIVGTVGLTASGEYSLARMAGFDWQVAWLLPFVIDVYVIQAFRRRRDILQAIGLTVAANVTYHLADAGIFGVVPSQRGEHEPTWWLIALVASIASLILWRIHLMQHPHKMRERQPDAHSGKAVQATERAHRERPSAKPDALTKPPSERAQEPPNERIRERSPERPAKSKSERGERAQKKPKTSAPKPMTDRRRERVRALYDELGKRPEWTEIRDALVAAKLAEKTISRATCQRVRDAIEKDEPKLAELGSDNVRALTGS